MRLKNILLCAWLLLAGGATFGQEPLAANEPTGLQTFSENFNTRVFGDKINVRRQPSKNAETSDQLVAGDAVTVLAADTVSMQLNGVTANWHKISYQKNGTRKEGYVWGGVLALGAFEVKDLTFVYGLVQPGEAKTEEGDNLQAFRTEIRAVRAGKVIATAAFDFNVEPGYYTDSRLFGSLGLKPFSNVLNIDFSYDACGYASYHFWCLWDGKQLVALPELISIADAGAFAFSESYIFPEDPEGMGGPDELLYRHDHYETIDEEGLESDRRVRVRKMLKKGNSYTKPVIED